MSLFKDLNHSIFVLVMDTFKVVFTSCQGLFLPNVSYDENAVAELVMNMYVLLLSRVVVDKLVTDC